MKNRFALLVSIGLPLALTVSGCSVIGDIFKAGVGIGILMVVIVLGLIFFIISKMSKK